MSELKIFKTKVDYEEAKKAMVIAACVASAIAYLQEAFPDEYRYISAIELEEIDPSEIVEIFVDKEDGYDGNPHWQDKNLWKSSAMEACNYFGEGLVCSRLNF